MTTSSWQLVLYGRTARADRWWRVRPRAADLGWLNDVVTTTTAGGEGLDAGPRFVLARRRGQTLVGGVSRAALLSETMNSDGSRPFYTFVGWFSEDPDVAVPDLETLDAQWPRWAGDEYHAWMPLDWNRHQSDLTLAHEPPITRPPWTEENADLAEPRLPETTQQSVSALDGSYPDTAPSERSVQWRRAVGALRDAQLVVGPATAGAAEAEHGPQQLPPGPSRSDPPPPPGQEYTSPGPPEAATNPTSPPTERGLLPAPTRNSAAFNPAWSSPPLAPSPAVRPGPPASLFHKLKQFINGVNEDTLEAPPAEARTPMANDLEYFRLQEQQKSAKRPPAKHPRQPPDTGG